MTYYKDLREYVEALDKAGKLVRITHPINKDTQLVPLCVLQSRGLSGEQMKVFLFTNVFDSRGKKYDIPVLFGTSSGPPEIDAIGLQCQPEEITDKVAQAFMHPIEPSLVEQGPVQDVVYMGDRLLEKGGMDEFPIPITHPGWDAGPIMASSSWVTKDPDTGVRNVGVYRSQLYAQDRLGIHQGRTDAHLTIHWQKCRTRGISLQAAIVVGGPPNLNYVGPVSLPFGVDEYTLSGGFAGQAVELVKCKTVDLEVPANADIVIEGELTTEELEMEAPHGEGAKGYVGMEVMQPYFTVKCITHRKDPIWLGEGGRQAFPGYLLKRLRYDLNMSHVLAVGYHSSVFPSHLVPIKMKFHTDQKEVWRTLEAVRGKIVIAVDEDIDIQDPDMLWWAIGTRSEPHRDFRIVKYLSKNLTSSSIIPEDEMKKLRNRQFDPNVPLPEGSRLLINATLKWPYPPMYLPKKEFMEEALAIWQELGLPPLKLKEPWYGYEYEWGYWPKEAAEDADRAVKGEYYTTSEMRAKKRVKLPKGEY